MKALVPLAFWGVILAAQQPPTLRLPSDVAPTRYKLDLTLDPKKTEYSGEISIDLNVRKPTTVIWLNASKLSVSTATLGEGTLQAAHIVPGGEDFVGFEFEQPLKTGNTELTVKFSGKVNSTSGAGVFSSKRNNDQYLFTEFEPIDARSAFPCFDEPAFKVPWQLTLHVPREDVAVSNTAVVSEQPEGAMKKVVFRETKPLPSYLVAFGVGPLEFVEAGRAGRAQVPVRIVVPRGDKPRAKYAAEVTAEILTKLEEYFGIPYPYDKADQLSIPLSFGGAMENPGLVTYDAQIILAPPQGEDTEKRQRLYASVAAHELAHQWFGDLVTMAWWNDTWLNESFATFMEKKLLTKWKPDWQWDVETQIERGRAMWMDRLASARRIDQPVNEKNEIGSAFDGITYLKGGSVLGMFDHSMGEEKFRQAVRMYLNKHAWGNGTADDFLDALREMGGPDVPASFKTFLQQAGVPEINMQLRCEDGRAHVEMSQQRFRPLGSPGADDQTWKIPVCVSYGISGERHRECTSLNGKTGTFNLSANGCPAWFLGNSEEVGYYNSKYEAPALETLIANRSQLSLAEQVGLYTELYNMVRAGRVNPSETLKLAVQLRDERSRQLVEAAVNLARVDPLLLPEEARPKYVAYVEQNFSARARALGWIPKTNESEDDRFIRVNLVPFVAREGNDQQLIASAKQLTDSWLGSRTPLPADLMGDIFSIAARNGDRALQQRLLSAVEKEKDEFIQNALFTALGAFRKRELVEENLQNLFGGKFDWRLAYPVLLWPLRNPEVAQLPLQYVKANYDNVITKLPSAGGSDYGSLLPRTAEVGCSSIAAEEAQSFFGPRMGKVNGGPRALAQTVETIKLCEARKSALQADLVRFLQ